MKKQDIQMLPSILESNLNHLASLGEYAEILKGAGIEAFNQKLLQVAGEKLLGLEFPLSEIKNQFVETLEDFKVTLSKKISPAIQLKEWQYITKFKAIVRNPFLVEYLNSYTNEWEELDCISIVGQHLHKAICNIDASTNVLDRRFYDIDKILYHRDNFKWLHTTIFDADAEEEDDLDIDDELLETIYPVEYPNIVLERVTLRITKGSSITDIKLQELFVSLTQEKDLLFNTLNTDFGKADMFALSIERDSATQRFCLSEINIVPLARLYRFLVIRDMVKGNALFKALAI